MRSLFWLKQKLTIWYESDTWRHSLMQYVISDLFKKTLDMAIFLFPTANSFQTHWIILPHGSPNTV